MADDLVPDWRVQASFKFGLGQEHMLNVRADDFDELGGLLESIPANIADRLGSAAAALTGVQTVAQGMGGSVTTVSVQDSAPSGGGVPSCAHGQRVFKASKPGAAKTWAAFFCNTPQNAKNKCDPIWKNDDNEDEPYWP